MKKWYLSFDWKRFSNRKAKYEQKRKGRWNKHRKRIHKRKYRERRPILKARHLQREAAFHARTVISPEVFSFINNTQEVLIFLNKLQDCFKRKSDVKIDLRHCTTLGVDTLTVLLSCLYNERFRPRHCQVYFQAPHDHTARQVWEQCNIKQYLVEYTSNPQIKPSKGNIVHVQNKEVEAQQTAELIRNAMQDLYDTPPYKCLAIQTIFIELMGNTHEHATIKTTVHETWWASVYYDEHKKKAQFIFVDNGIGIFETALLKTIKSLYNDLPSLFDNDAEIFRDVLTRKYRTSVSRTRQSNRGNGLPEIYERFKEGFVSNLIIISNHVVAKMQENIFTTQKIPFQGTFFYWEHGHENRRN